MIRALVALAVVVSVSARADTLRGKRLYLDAARIVSTPASCVDCHGGLPGGAFAIEAAANDPAAVETAIATVPQMAPFRDRLVAADYVDLAAYLGDPGVASPEVRVTTMLPGGEAGLTDRIVFDELAIGDESAPAIVELHNPGALAFTITAAPVLEGDFVLAATDCAAGLALEAATSCSVAVAFAPTRIGERTGRIVIAHDWVRGAAALALSGTARPPVVMPPSPPPAGCAVGRASSGWLVLALWLSSRARRGSSAARRSPDRCRRSTALRPSS